MIILFGLCTKFGHDLEPRNPTPGGEAQLEVRYAMFQDTHVMMLLGFGFLYTLLRRYAWSGVSWNYIITVLTIQWAMLTLGFWKNVRNHRMDKDASGFPSIPLSVDSLVDADYVAATVLISFGAVIGRLSATQAVLMTFLEVIFVTANNVICLDLSVTDPGGSMVIHTMGAAFGLGVALVLGDKAAKGQGNGESKLGTSRHNGTFAMIGTLFLFCFWPSFNAALLSGAAQHRAVINTVLSITSSVISSFVFSKAIHNGKKFDMEHIQNSTLAGGVAIGALCDMLANPWGAMFCGSVSGIVSVYGFSFFGPALKRMGLTDTCGILNLHLMPGFIGGIASAIAAAGIEVGTGETDWAQASVDAFPGRGVQGRSAVVQGGYQMAMTVISLAFGLLSGAFTGFVLKAPFADPQNDSFYEDAGSWNVPLEDEETPELAADVSHAILAQRNEIVQTVLAQVSKQLGVNIKAPLIPVPAASAPQGTSANDRFFEGSVHKRNNGEGSVHGRIAAASQN